MQVLNTGAAQDVVWEEIANSTVLARCLERWVLEAYSGCLRAASVADAFAQFDRSRILCAVRHGPLGVATVNRMAEQILDAHGLLHWRGPWYRGRPVLVSRNDYQLKLFNGDIGIAWDDAPRPETGRMSLGVMFPTESGELRRIVPSRLPEHEAVYAMTVHKAQGSEFDRVLLILPDKDLAVLSRELLYTAITRARKRVEIWARREAIEACIAKRVTRHSGLRDALSERE
jgi:exodeoxyribonuclease V alpha subunit